MRQENWIWCALKSSVDVCPEVLSMISRRKYTLDGHSYINRADEVFISHQDICHGDPKEDS